MKFNDIRQALAPTPAQGPRPLPKPKQGEILLPISAVPLHAYERIPLAALTYVPYPKSKLDGTDVLTRAQDIALRVPRVNIEKTSPIREKMLLPKEAPPGIAGAIPDGWVAARLDRTQVEGTVKGLSPGDYVALFSPGVKWISQKALVLVPYVEKSETKGGGTKPGLLRPEKEAATTTLSGELTLAVPAKESEVLSKVLALGKDKVRVMLLSAGSATVDLGEGAAVQQEVDRPETQEIQQIKGPAVQKKKVPSAPLDQPGGV
jgi:hypothetical protein